MSKRLNCRFHIVSNHSLSDGTFKINLHINNFRGQANIKSFAFGGYRRIYYSFKIEVTNDKVNARCCHFVNT